MIELLDHRDISDVTQAVCVDSALSYHGTAKSVFSGLDHLEGMTVSILAGGNELPQQTVTGGSITLSQSFTDVVVGLPYACELETLGIEAELKTGTSQMVKKKLSGLGVRLLNSRGGEYGEDFEHMYEIPVHSGKQTTDPLPLFSGKKELSINGSYERECRACIRTTRPLPMTILALVPEISVG